MKNKFTKVLLVILCLLCSFTGAEAYTTTTNYVFQLPQVNNATDQDLWGTELNGNFTSIDSLLLTASNDIPAALTGDTTISASYQNKVILGNAASASFTVTLLTATSAGAGFKVSVKKTDSTVNTVTVKGNGSELIDLANTYVISSQNNVITLVSDGSQWWGVSNIVSPPTGGVKTVHKQIFTSGGTYTPTAGLVNAIVEVQAGGGGGGGTNGAGASSGGGGAGSHSKSWLTAASIGSSQSITVGAGGAGGANTGGTGGTGGASSFGSLVTANGGSGGVGSTAGSSPSNADGGAGGAAGTGDVTIEGQRGTGGICTLNGPTLPGVGGSTPLGSGGISITSPGGGAGGANGNPGTGYGAGGGGANTTSHSGGAGTGGIIIITEFCSQ